MSDTTCRETGCVRRIARADRFLAWARAEEDAMRRAGMALKWSLVDAINAAAKADDYGAIEALMAEFEWVDPFQSRV